MAHPFNNEARTGSSDVVSPLTQSESFRIPRKSVGGEKYGEKSTTFSTVDSDENGISPLGSPNLGRYEPLQHNGSSKDISPAGRPAGFRRLSHALRWWRFEIIACFFTVACMAGQIVALAYVDEKPQDAWGSDVLTLNGFIAILSTLHRMSMMAVMGAAIAQTAWNRISSRDRDGSFFPIKDFVTMRDTANGGIRGALQVLWRYKGLHIACLGGLLVVLCLGIDAFYQQLIDLRVDLVPDTSAEAPLLNIDRAAWVDSVHGYANAWVPSRATKLAMYNGFMATNMDVPPAVCPTGNCTWPIVPTVGVCGACVDMTDEIRIVNRTAPRCTAVTDSGLELTGNCQFPDFAPVFTLGPGSGRVFSGNSSSVIKRKGKPDLPVPPANAPNVITQFGAVGVPMSKLPAGLLGDSIASECALWYCLQSHNVSVQAGKLSDKVVEIWSEASTEDGSNDVFMYNVTFNNIPKSFNTEDDVLYGLGSKQVFAMRAYTNETIFGNVSADANAMLVTASTDFAEGIHESFEDIDKWMDRLTMSMTNEIRVNQGREQKVAQELEKRYASTVYVNQVTTVVRWGWIVYPAVITLLTIVYMVIEMFRTAYSNAEPWKQDEFMPLCLSIVDDDARREISAGQMDPKGLGKRMGNMRLGLRRRDGHNGPLGLTRT